MSAIHRLAALCLTLTTLALGGCGESPPSHATGVYMLLDTSGTYTEEIDKAQQIINYTLTRLQPGDSFAVARIDTASFSEKDIVAKATFDDRPSTANGQKREFQAEIDEFVKTVHPSAYTDISGGLLQAQEYLNEKSPGHRTIFIFSDLKEDLEKGFVRDFPLTFRDTDVVALNVTKLRSDNVNPREYLDRLAAWQKRVEESGGRWRVINDLDHLERLFQT